MLSSRPSRASLGVATAMTMALGALGAAGVAEARPGDRDLRFGGGDGLVPTRERTGLIRSARLPDGKLLVLTGDRLLRLEAGRLRTLRRTGRATPVDLLPDGRHGVLLARARAAGLELLAVDPRGGVRKGFGSAGTLLAVPADEREGQVVARRGGGLLTASVVVADGRADVRVRVIDADGRTVTPVALGLSTAGAVVEDLAADRRGGAWLLVSSGSGATQTTRLIHLAGDGRPDGPVAAVPGFAAIVGVDRGGAVALLDFDGRLVRVSARGRRTAAVRTPGWSYLTRVETLDDAGRLLVTTEGQIVRRLTRSGRTDPRWRRGGVLAPRPRAVEYDPYAYVAGMHPRPDGTLDVVLQRGESYDSRIDFEDFPSDVAVVRLEGADLVRLDAAQDERATVRCLRAARTACRVTVTARVGARVVARTTARIRAGTRRRIPFGAPRGTIATVRATDARGLVSTDRRRVR